MRLGMMSMTLLTVKEKESSKEKEKGRAQYLSTNPPY